jgi:hypothetical protein
VAVIRLVGATGQQRLPGGGGVRRVSDWPPTPRAPRALRPGTGTGTGTGTVAGRPETMEF